MQCVEQKAVLDAIPSQADDKFVDTSDEIDIAANDAFTFGSAMDLITSTMLDQFYP